MTSMTGKERMTAAMRGEPVDRVPIWLREGFSIGQEPAEADDFGRGWQADPIYRDLFAQVEAHAALVHGWGIPGMNRLLMVPSHVMSRSEEEISDELRRATTAIQTPRGVLEARTDYQRGVATGWAVKKPIESLDQLKMLAEVPFELNHDQIDQAVKNYQAAKAFVGDRGILRMGLSSPIVIISGGMPLELFLELSFTERSFFHELCEMITERMLMILDELFSRGVTIEGTVNLGGSEQCTPPMMRPEAFDDYVVPYDGTIIKRVKAEGLLVNMHCHGKVRHALKCMVDMGVDSTDPLEPPPSGDVTYEEAREIVGDQLTIVGNLQFDELEFAKPEEIREHVKRVLSHGNRRLILAASAGPISRVSQRLADNIRAWVETAMEFGG